MADTPPRPERPLDEEPLSLKLIAGRLGIATPSALLAFARERGIAPVAAVKGGMPLYDVAILSAAVEANRTWFEERATRVALEQAEQCAAAEARRSRKAKAERQTAAAKRKEERREARRASVPGPEVIVLTRRGPKL